MKWVKISQSYSINENGDVRNDKTGHIKIPFVNKANGYKTVDLWEDGKSHKKNDSQATCRSVYSKPGKQTDCRSH